MDFLKNINISDYIDLEEIINTANIYLTQKEPTITDFISENSEGTKNDYYSNGDYWWPNPDTDNNLPYIRRDGFSNPENFNKHRQVLNEMNYMTGYLTAAYKITNNNKYAEKVISILYTFFLDDDKKMNPNMLYAQSIPGVCSGRGIGIIDTLHLTDVSKTIKILKNIMSLEIYNGLKKWFCNFINWLITHPQGIEEMNEKNNHSIAFFVQLASFANITDNQELLQFIRDEYKNVLLPEQMAKDGSLPLELERTKPYIYSSFTLDNLVNICLLASSKEDDLWNYVSKNNRSIKLGIEFFTEYVEDISKWPYKKDVANFRDFPVAMSYLLFSGLKFNDTKLLNLWNRLEKRNPNIEIKRNSTINCPYLYFE